MKHWTAFLLALLMLSQLVLPAAAESADARLARVTEAVKNTLDLDTDDYTDFQGNVSEEPLGTTWNLFWTGEGKNLGVDALEDGTVVGYACYDGRQIYSASANLPAFPVRDGEKAMAAARAFLDRVLDKRTESVELEVPELTELRAGSEIYFNGRILLNGLPSPLSYSISVRTTDYTVTNFFREAPSMNYLGSIPSPATKVAQADAAAKLKDTLELELIYAASDEKDDSHHAVLRYVPRNEKPWAVDALTGELLDLSQSGRYAANSSAAGVPAEAEEDAMDAGMSRKQLNEVEKAGVEKLEGVLDKESLDRKVRAESAYKLQNYKLSSAGYRQVKEDDVDKVYCTLQYTRELDENRTLRRTFSVDARTGAVSGLWSGTWWDKERKVQVSAETAKTTAESFLKRFTAHAADLELYDTADNTADGAPSYTFTFVRKANGVFFPQDACAISVDCEDGAISGLNWSYDEKAVFDSPEGIVSAQAALDAWMDSYQVTLAYRAHSRELDPKVAAEDKLIALGMDRFSELLLTYGLDREGWFSGVDAKTGKVMEETFQQEELTYEDVESSWAKTEIETLARYGVGYAGGKFQPGKELTQWALVCLVTSTRGVRTDPETEDKEERSGVYEAAYRMGMLTPEERKDEAAVTRGELVKMLLNAAGYGPTARLKGIFTTAYSDGAAIPQEDLGYAALAQGLGMVRGAYNAAGYASRATAAVMLCRLMSREG